MDIESLGNGRRTQLYSLAVQHWFEKAKSQGRADTVEDFLSFLSNLSPENKWDIPEDEAADITLIYNNLVNESGIDSNEDELSL